MNQFKNKIVAVTGAAGQLGAAWVEAYESRGAIVIALDLEFAPRSLPTSGSIECIQTDITSEKDVQATFASIATRHGGIDILVNNAGAQIFSHFNDRTEDEFEHVVNVNMKGTFLCIKHFAKLMAKSESRSVLNLGSIYGSVSPDFRIYGAQDRRSAEVYGATKGGVIQMTKYFAVALADQKIRVNCISPGGIYNPKSPQSSDFISEYIERCPMKRMAEANEIVEPGLFLTSDAASYITGQNLLVDGGFTSW